MNPLPPTAANGREEAEPRMGALAAPVWLFVLAGVLFYWGTLHLDQAAGGFNQLVYEPFRSYAEVDALQPKSESDLLYNEGKREYAKNCSACHQTSGAGVPGQFPPLAGSDWVNAEGPNRIIRVVLNSLRGPIEISGNAFDNPSVSMPPWRDVLTDQQIAAVLTYVRGSKDWGHKAGAVTPEQVKAIRDATQDRGEQWTVEELLQVPVK